MKIKKSFFDIVLFFLAALLLFAFIAPFRVRALAEEDTAREIKIATKEDFFAFAAACNADAGYSVGKSVYLAADIDFSGSSFKGISLFCGTFHGGYHTLSHITIEADGDNAGVFGALSAGAVVERLYVEDMTIAAEDAANVGFVGLNYGTIFDVTVEGTITAFSRAGGVCGYNGESVDGNGEVRRGEISSCVSSCEVDAPFCAGGIAGYSAGDIVSCANYGGVDSARASSSSECVGGIAGFLTGRAVSCVNYGTVGSESADIYVGGICGYAEGAVYYGENYGSVSAFSYSGGVCGYVSQGEAGEILYCINGGEVAASSCAGGICGGASASVRGCLSYGDVTARQGGYAGGICALQESGEISCCFATGSVTAEGQAGYYVGGIAGYGVNVSYGAAFCLLAGENYVGGLCGLAAGALYSCYADSVVLCSNSYAGGVAGFAAAYDMAANDFGGLVRDNFYVGEGGIAGVIYGALCSYAATPLTEEQLVSDGALSPYLSSGFGGVYWTGGEGETAYPMLSCFTSALFSTEYGDGADFEERFAAFRDTILPLARQYAARTRTVVFLEWDETKGDLYDGEGNLWTEHFSVTASYRLYAGESLSAYPGFLYAEEQDGRYVYEGAEGLYAVGWTEGIAASGVMLVYAEYQRLVDTLSLWEAVEVEGLFEEDTVLSLEQSGDYYALRFTLGGEEKQYASVTVRFFVGDDADKYAVYAADGAGVRLIESEADGQYVRFSYEGGYFFFVKEESESYAWLIAVLIGVVLVCAVAGVAGFWIGRKTKKT